MAQHSIEGLREALHDFAISYHVESADGRKADLDYMMDIIAGHTEEAVALAQLKTIDDVFRMSSKKKFIEWKPQDAFMFYERLKAYERELKALQPPAEKDGEGG